jgi:hypothetical protein
MKNFVRKTTTIFQKYLKLETVFKNLRTWEHLKASSFGVSSVITSAGTGAAQYTAMPTTVRLQMTRQLAG